ncbi:MAG: DUF4388 domain-containing protein [Myxococcales bacterium]|nr:DUF4388 domain-containing protein [Myxococcales bacterium]
MVERQNALVRIDGTGAAHPVGREASREMRGRQGGMRLLPSPSHCLVMRAVDEAGSDKGAHFWLSGEIAKPGVLWDLIGLAGQGNWSGELVVIAGDIRRAIFFERGTVIGAYSNAERERLGEVLYEYGALTREQISLVAEAANREKRFGEVAVALGFMSREKLFELIGKQAEEILYAVMLVGEGSFYFVEDFDESRLPYRLNLAVQGLLMEGVRRMDEMELFRARIPSGLYVPDVVDGATLPPGHEHAAVFQAVDGTLSVDDVGRLIGAGSFETTRALFQLMQLGVIALHPPRPTGPQAIVTLFNQAISLILSKVDEVSGGDDVREQLSSFATASGVYDALFRDAGPYEDGTLDPQRIADTVQVLVGPGNAETMLAQWLYEYASFAMFIAEPLLRARPTSDDAGPLSEGAVVSRKVAELLAPLAPEG